MRKIPSNHLTFYNKIKILALIASILALALIYVGIYVGLDQDNGLVEDKDNNLAEETFKISLQFLLLVVVGGIWSMLISQYARERERRDIKRDEYRDFLSSFIKDYNSAKRIRRLLKAEVRVESNAKKEVIMVKSYRKQMQALIDVQLNFEYLKRFAQDTDYTELRDLGEHLKSMEKYLNKLVEEYEKSYGLFSKDESCSIEDLPALKEFIGRTDRHVLPGNFHDDFTKEGRKVRKKMLKILTD